MTDIKKIKDLIKLMVANDLTELDLEGDGERVTLKREMGQVNLQRYGASPLPLSTVSGEIPGPEIASTAISSNGPATEASQDGSGAIASPMVGTFYTASSPDAKPFVTVGDHVSEDTVVCIIEAMKVFNEIKAEVGGTIEKVLVGSGQAVEYDQPLFLVRPD